MTGDDLTDRLFIAPLAFGAALMLWWVGFATSLMEPRP